MSNSGAAGAHLKSEFLQVAEILLRRLGPMTAKDLVNEAFDQGLFSHQISGRTPAQTMKSKLSTHIRVRGDTSRFIRTGPGKFWLRDLLGDAGQEYKGRRTVPPPAHENVLVFQSSVLDVLGRFQGIRRGFRRYAQLLRPPTAAYTDRLAAEQRDDVKQVLTYILVTRGHRLLVFKRGTYNRAEEFLRGSYCIGFGGHVVERDRDLFNIRDGGLFESAARELSEELVLPDIDRERLKRHEGLELLGVLNDDSSSVGRRHFAYVMRYETSDDSKWERPLRGEKSITQLAWIDSRSPDLRLPRFEYWSQLCFLTFYRSIAPRTDYLMRRRAPLKPPHILCIVGPIGCGKTEATQLLTRDFGYVEVNSGRVLAELMKMPPVPETERSVFQRAAWRFVSRKSGPKRLATALATKADAVGGERILIDGIRQKATLRELRLAAHGRRVGVIYVHTPAHIAFTFYADRVHDEIDQLAFLRLREQRVEQDAVAMLPEADAVLYNWAGKEAYRATVRDLMTRAGVSPMTP